MAPYREISLGRPGLRGWVHGARDRAAGAHRMPPYWFASLGVSRRFDAAGRVEALDPMLLGPTRSSYFYAPKPRTELIALSFQPTLAPALAGLRLDHIAPDHVWADHRGLLDAALRAAAARAPADTVLKAILDAVLARLTSAAAGPASHALALIRRSGGRMRFGALADRLEVSERHLRRLVTDAAGVGPKPYARLCRLNAAIAAADHTASPHWSAIAADFGYADQAHLIRDVRTATGLSPARLHEERVRESDLFKPCA